MRPHPLSTKARRRVLLALCLTLGAGARAQTPAPRYPSQPVKLVVPFSPGGTTDLAARLLAEYASRELGQPVVVENRAGAGGSLGMEAVARATPDGYTLGMATVSTHGSNAAAYGSRLRYDPVRDFQPVSNVATVPGVFCIGADLPAKTLAEFIELAKASPGKYTFGTPGTGSLAHANVEYFAHLANMQLLHIPYKGSGTALNDVIAGQIDVIQDQVPSVLPHIRSGRLRPLAVSSEKRLPQLPDVPTYAELGFKDLVGGGWFGVVAPARTPPAVVERLNQAIHKALQQPEFIRKMTEAGATLIPNTPEQFGAQIKQAVARYAYVAKVAKIAAE